MHEINVKIWRNHFAKNWTLEINSERHDAITMEWIHELVYRAILDAEESLINSVARRKLQ